jgi:hypothetical protein
VVSFLCGRKTLTSDGGLRRLTGGASAASEEPNALSRVRCTRMLGDRRITPYHVSDLQRCETIDTVTEHRVPEDSSTVDLSTTSGSILASTTHVPAGIGMSA